MLLVGSVARAVVAKIGALWNLNGTGHSTIHPAGEEVRTGVAVTILEESSVSSGRWSVQVAKEEATPKHTTSIFTTLHNDDSERKMAEIPRRFEESAESHTLSRRVC